MAKTVAARKAKGMRLQKKIASALLEAFELKDTEIRSIPGSVPGPDLWMSQAAIEKMGDWDIEAKNQEKISIWAAIKQLWERNNDKDKALIFSRNGESVYVCISLNNFIYLLKNQRKDHV